MRHTTNEFTQRVNVFTKLRLFLHETFDGLIGQRSRCNFITELCAGLQNLANRIEGCFVAGVANALRCLNCV